MGIRALDSTAMNLLQAVILAVLAVCIGAAQQTPKCNISEDAQVVLADRRAKKLFTWTPNFCIPETIRSYPVPRGSRKYISMMTQCGRMIFAQLEAGGTQLVAYDLLHPKGGWKPVRMPRELSNVINYAITCWRTHDKLLVIGGRILNGPDGNKGQPVNTTWSLDWAKGRFDWEKLRKILEIPAYGSCAVVTTPTEGGRGDILTVMSGMTRPGHLVKRVYF